MRVFGESLPPIGHVGFCRRNPAECRRRPAKMERLGMTESRRQGLQMVNNMVNRMVKPVSDQDLYGRLEHWTYPAGRGDCEDYVLLKHRLLLERGWPQSALLITVVRDENNEGHAVLTVRTAQGDYVLDNKRSEVLRWNRTGYAFVKRQSSRNPRIWMSLAPTSAPRATPISGTRSN
ncbi:MAG: transglutaminase-like cysteine peptidase [Methyloligellaceae bacterium]